MDREEEGSVQLSDIVYIANYFKKKELTFQACVYIPSSYF